MPVTKSQRPSARAHASRSKPKIVIDDCSSSETDLEDDDELSELRRSRASYYSKSPEERLRTARPMAQEKGKRKSDTGGGSRRARGSTASVHVVGSRSSVSHRRRRRRKEDEDEDEGDFVYKQPAALSRASLPARAKTQRSSASQNARKVSGSDRNSVLDRLGLATPQRRVSVRSTKVSDEPLQRRHSYNEGVKRRTSVRSLDDPDGSSPRRSVSVRESSKSGSKPLSRSNTTQTRRTRHSSQALPMVLEEPKAPTSPRPRQPTVFGSLFSGSKAAAADARVTCVTCLSEDLPIARTAKLGCSHRMCHSCLKRIFTLSVTDPAHMPPKCCTQECIPLKHVDKLFETKFKAKWNRKYQEYTTKNRIYCPSRGCGAWIPPKDIRPDPRQPRRKYGKCRRCKTYVCATCNNKWHKSSECPNDEATLRFVEMAKDRGWQRCYNCRATVELKEGCNHMTCRCTAQFCMICGAKWKTCDCPWFNYTNADADRLNHMNIAEIRRVALDPDGAAALNAPRAYHEELDRRRTQEHNDEEMARRMQDLDIDLGRRSRRRVVSDDPAEGGGVFAFGNAVRHFMNEDFVQRAHHILTGPYNQEQHDAADQLVAEIRGHQRTDDLGADLPVRRATTGSRRASAPATGVVPGRGREAEMLVPRRRPGDYGAQAARVRPQVSVRKTARTRTSEGSGEAETRADSPSRESTKRAATLAGLNKKSTQGRVDAWRRHVEGGAE